MRRNHPQAFLDYQKNLETAKLTHDPKYWSNEPETFKEWKALSINFNQARDDVLEHLRLIKDDPILLMHFLRPQIDRQLKLNYKSVSPKSLK